MLRLQSPDAWFLYACYGEHKQASLLGLTRAGGGADCVQGDEDGDIGERALDGAQGSLLLVAREGQDLGREQDLIETLRIPSDRICMDQHLARAALGWETSCCLQGRPDDRKMGENIEWDYLVARQLSCHGARAHRDGRPEAVHWLQQWRIQHVILQHTLRVQCSTIRTPPASHSLGLIQTLSAVEAFLNTGQACRAW